MRIIICLVFAFLVSCSEPDTCEKYTDLCMDGSDIDYEICVDEYGDGYTVIDGKNYYNTEAMVDELCF